MTEKIQRRGGKKKWKEREKKERHKWLLYLGLFSFNYLREREREREAGEEMVGTAMDETEAGHIGQTLGAVAGEQEPALVGHVVLLQKNVERAKLAEFQDHLLNETQKK
jgi:hypothetical protein